MTVPMTWLMLRSTGVIALVLLTLSVVVGIASPALRRPSWRLSAISIHSTAAASGVALLLGHVVFAVADSFVDIPLLAVVVPGVSVWEPIWIGLGATAVDLFALIMITSALRGRGPVIWRKVHVLAYPAWVLSWGHAMTAGTDATSEPMLILAAASALAVGLATVFRMRARPDDAPMSHPQTPVALTGGVR